MGTRKEEKKKTKEIRRGEWGREIRESGSKDKQA